MRFAMNRLARMAVLYAASVAVSTVWAQSPALLTDGQIAVTEADIQATNLRTPAEARKRALSRPEVVKQQAENILVRRKLAQEARAAGLEKDPAMKALVDISVERVLSDLWLEKMDLEATPNDAALEKLARAIYVADPLRFAKPASVNASHILIKKEVANGRELAEKLLTDLKSGASFEELAKTHSGDPGSAAKGGNLGNFARGRMVKPFEEAAYALEKPGQLSDIVETQFGFHIIRLDEKVAAGLPASFEEVRRQLLNEARTRAVTEARATTQARVLGTAKADNAAIEAFSAKQR